MKIAALVCTLNEAAHIAQRLENLCAQIQPQQVDFHIHILDNGSSDATAAMARAKAANAVFTTSVHILPPIGKCAALFWAFEYITADYFILTDANTIFSPHVLVEVCRNIVAFPDKGLRIGNTRNFTSVFQGTSFIESNARLPLRMRAEAFLGISTGANGACYCVKKSAVKDIGKNPPVRNDDFVISIYAAARGGFSFLMNARAYEVEERDARRTWRDKYRDALGHGQAILWILRNVSPAIARKAVAARLVYWCLPFITVIVGFCLFQWYFLVAALMLVLFSGRIRLATIRAAALAIGFVVGAFKPPAPKWLPRR